MRTRQFLVALIAIALLAASGLAAKEEPPAPAPAKNFALPDVRKLTLDNGLQVRLVHYGNVPKVSISLVDEAGNVREAADQVWLADLMGNLMEQGTATRSAQQVALEAAKMGGAVAVSVGPIEATVNGDALSEFAPAMIRLLADVARNPLLPEQELARLKADLQRNLSIARSQQQQLANEKFLATLYPDQPYGRLFPTPAMIDSYTIAQVRDFYRNNFGAARARLYVAGKFDDAATEAAIRAAFGDWAAGTKPAAITATPKSGRSLQIIDRPGAVQSTIYIGLPVVDPSSEDWVALAVTNALLGGSFGSRITSNIREQKGYTYSPRSAMTPYVNAAHWAEIADVTTNVTGPALGEIVKEITRLRGEPPTAAELSGIQKYLAGTFVLQNSSRGGIINLLSFVDRHGLRDAYLSTFVQKVYAMTPAEVQRIAQKYFDPASMAIVVAGDVKTIKEQLDPFAVAR